MSKFVFLFLQSVPQSTFILKMGLTLISCSGSKLQIRAWEMLPVVAQQLLFNAGGYTFFEVAYLDVNRLVLT
jgi:hypothetical protein